MKYAIWKLNFTNPEYGTGPESLIAELGGYAEGGWVSGQAELGGDILGYVTGEFASEELSKWDYREVTQVEALEFAQAINADAFLTEDGYIGYPAKH